jgi:DNA-binding NtrC family response regulator
MSHRILVVDDDALIRETLEHHFRSSGAEVAVAASAESALAQLRSFAPGLMITDVRMSGMDGITLLSLVHERAPDVDVVVMTAFQDMRTAVSAMKAGAYDYLVKPLDLDQIDAVVDRCFRERSLRRRVEQLSAEAAEGHTLDQLVGADPRMIEIYKRIGMLARVRTPVLVRGDTGTGKELIARAIHFNSPDAEEPFVAVNCTAIPEPLLESELFGHTRGAFTGATSDRRGRFELAGRGTVFLDEIGDTTPAFQAKLLRVLQEHEFYPVGAESVRRCEARIIAATHRPLEQLVADGRFREDLYFRLRVVEITVPPLRERAGDVPALAEHLLRIAARDAHRAPLRFSNGALRRLCTHTWPGNVRELENAVRRAVVVAPGGIIEEADLALGAATLPDSTRATPVSNADQTLAAVERAHLEQVLRECGGNKRRACRTLGLTRPRLDRLLERHGIRVTVSDPEQ